VNVTPSGRDAARVLEMRRDFQRMMKQRYSQMIEQLTGRKVLASSAKPTSSLI
jgi:hypothetical protein